MPKFMNYDTDLERERKIEAEFKQFEMEMRKRYNHCEQIEYKLCNRCGNCGGHDE